MARQLNVNNIDAEIAARKSYDRETIQWTQMTAMMNQLAGAGAFPKTAVDSQTTQAFAQMQMM